MSLGNLIRKYRLKAGFTQYLLAHTIGVTQTKVSDWERNISKPSKQNIARLALTLEIPKKEISDVTKLDVDDEVVKAINSNTLLSADVRKALIVLYKKMLAADSLFNKD